MIHINKLIKNYLVITFFIGFLSCKSDLKEKSAIPVLEIDSLKVDLFQESFRPQFHFTPPEKWMNDPNGMVFHKGIYHLFYQYYPEDIVWGPMHWGHATSADLIHWEHKGIKLFPDEHGYIFSGSAVVDHNNSSGLGSEEDPPLIAIFTYHDPKGEKEGKLNFQTQGLAYSNDNGDTWTKYKHNPIIENPGIKDIRDPKVRWHEPSKNWIMTLAVGDHISFYASKNLIQWEKLSDFGNEIGAHGGVWECPDLFPMPLGETDDTKWVLLVSINPGGPNGGSATQYFVGSFDGINFVPDDNNTRWIDYGADNYAGVTFSNVNDDKKLFIGWMSNWDYAQVTPTKAWRSAMTIPRELNLFYEDENYYLKSTPVESLENLYSNTFSKKDIEIKDAYELSELKIDQADILIETQLNQVFSIKISNKREEYVLLQFDPEKQLISFDRRKSGQINFSEKFANKIHTLPYSVSDKVSEIRIILDQASLEIFIDDGRYVMTEQVFPSDPYNKLSIISDATINIKTLNINQIKSIWTNE